MDTCEPRAAFVLVLKSLKKAIADGDRVHAVICGSAVNSDGRTSGISMPAEKYQIELLRSLYGPAGIAPDSVAFIEAHGTGTRVGDPVEASALGTVLGRARSRPLPIGSIKTNIGHTEPASGLAGLMKAMLALEHDESPPSLHAANLNPGIDFVGLNLQVARNAIPLSRASGRRFAGVSSFGFGGTSAHVVISDAPVARATADPAPRLMMISAQSEEALRALAGAYATRLGGASARERGRIVAATGRRRERMRERLALPAAETAALAPALARFAGSGEADANSVRATAVDGDGAIVFVFSGNGSQWSGMGRAAYQANAAFRDALAEVDSHFLPLAGWSLVEELDSADIATDLARTDVAQPMIFAIQAASVRALARVGVRPALTLGHSVGEVAAAEAAGVLSLSDATRVIFHRSRLQQATENAGGMAVVFGPREAAAELVSRIPGLAIAGHNSHRCVAVAGASHALDRLMTLAPAAKLRARRLDLPYPFHTELMQPVEKPLIAALATLKPSIGSVPFLSTVTDEFVQGPAAGAAYWWRNVRHVVRFQESVERALGAGKRVFLEIGPRPTLKTHLRDVAEHLDAAALVDCVLDESSGESGDPFEAAAMRLIAGGADVGQQWAFGPDPGPGVALPAYPWRRAPYRIPGNGRGDRPNERAGAAPSDRRARGRRIARMARDSGSANRAGAGRSPRRRPDPSTWRGVPGNGARGRTGLGWTGRGPQGFRNPAAACVLHRRFARDPEPDRGFHGDRRDTQPTAPDKGSFHHPRARADRPETRAGSRAQRRFRCEFRRRDRRRPLCSGADARARFRAGFPAARARRSRERRPHRGRADRRCGGQSLRPRPGPPRFLFPRAHPPVRRSATAKGAPICRSALAKRAFFCRMRTSQAPKSG